MIIFQYLLYYVVCLFACNMNKVSKDDVPSHPIVLRYNVNMEYGHGKHRLNISSCWVGLFNTSQRRCLPLCQLLCFFSIFFIREDLFLKTGANSSTAGGSRFQDPG